MKCKKASALLGALILSAGIFGAGVMIGKAVYYSKTLNRTVTVKGIAERDVKSDLGIWEIDYREVSNDLVDANKRLQHDQEVVTAFLKQHGFVDTEISPVSVKVDDRLANAYSQSNTTPANENTNRYIVTGGVRVRSTNVNRIDQVNTMSSALLQQGVALAFDIGGVSPNPSYYFSALDKIRPEMMADATRSAKTVAEQFAKDSGTELKGIQRASQGVFQIMSADSSTMSADWNNSQSALGSIDKKVRLVTTIDYRLK